MSIYCRYINSPVYHIAYADLQVIHPLPSSCFSKWKLSRTPDNSIQPPRCPVMAGWDSRASIFHLYINSILVFSSCPNNTMSSVVCLRQWDWSSRQLTTRLLPVSVASMEEAFHCLILPTSILGSANKAGPQQTASTSMLIKTMQASFACPHNFTLHPLV